MDFTKKALPIGTEDFEKLRKKNYYYVDKTGLIAELLRGSGEVNLFTRPRRFGKSLNMSMLKCFFEIGGDSSIFEGLEIAQETELCRTHMGKYPVVSVSLKDVEGRDFRLACRLAATRISAEASRFDFLRSSSGLSEDERELYISLLRRDMDQETLSSSLWDLCRLLEKHYGQKVILLIDEYDVPVQKAFYNGYYDEMVQLIRSMFSQALKTNSSLAFAVLTGCLRVSKESIFAGMNNLKVFSIADAGFDEYFGFTDEEVREFMEYYGLTDFHGKAREWYDGYRFGRSDVYCPWDVVNYCYDLRIDPNVLPGNYWANSSGNDAVQEFVKRLEAGAATRELEALVAGDAVRKEIRQELTYREMYDSIDHIWSLLYMTGYLTKRGEAEGKKLPLVIPNMEIRDIFTTQIMDLFREHVADDGVMLREFCGALKDGDTQKTEELLGKYLKKTISIRDTFIRHSLRENFYHGILLGILSFKGNWYVTSNYETGDGYGDILVETEDEDIGIVIEVKYAHNGDLEKGVEMALKQIEDSCYAQKLHDSGIRTVLKYGIACYRKQCRVALVR